MSLSKKMLRDIRFNKTQFISIFLMAYLGIFAYCGICSEYYGLEQTSSEFYNETNLADAWIYNTNINDSYLDEVNNFNQESERQLVIPSIGDFKNEPDITLHFVENNTISKFYVTEGEKFNLSDDSGVWLDKQFADAKKLKIGDNITFKFNEMEIEKEIKGLGYSPEYVYEASQNSITPNFEDVGFAYLSYKAFPSYITYNTLLVKFKQSNEDFKKSLDDNVDYLSFTKREDHVSVSQFLEEVAQHRMMGNVFPIVFIIVTFLTLLTTMSRIIAQQRTQIGILKAVGFGNEQIIIHYLSYGFWPILAGAILGLITGPLIIPEMFYPTMKTRYSLPSWHPGFDISFIYVAGLMVLSSLLITYLACKNISKENPADSIRPKGPNTPPTGLLEKSKLWHHLSFNIRWNLRDARRNKFRALMAIVGVMGCTALIVAAFGMNDCMNDLRTWEYDDINHFESKLIIANNASLSDINSINKKVNGSKIMQTVIEIKANNIEDTASILVSNNTNLISYTNQYKKPLTIKDGDISISIKLAEKFNLKIGDKIKWHIIGSDDWVKSKIGQIHAEPVSQGLIMSPTAIKDLKLNFTPTSIITTKKVDKDYDSIKYVTTLNKMKESWDKMTGSIMMMVYVIIVIAVILATVVLYNLGILSFTEIEREIATLKVLGFKTMDLRKLLLTQNLVFTTIGFGLGIPLGLYFMKLMMDANGKSLYYIPSLTWGNILLSAIITFTISIVVNLMFSSKIKNLDMVEALKDIE